MLHRMSSLLCRTLREDPADAEVASLRLLVRAGYLRRAAAGTLSWLPLGLRVLDRVRAAVRAEMAAIGGQEVRFPGLLPGEAAAGAFAVRDGRGAAYQLGPSHQELCAALVRAEVSSHRELPLVLFQLRTRYREDARPRAGLLGGRESQVLDSCSFDLDEPARDASCEAHRLAYRRVFERLGLRTELAEAFAGGARFLAPAAVGEDTFVTCAGCGYAATTQAVQIGSGHPGDLDPATRGRSAEPMAVLDTPDTPTIEALCALLGVPAAATLKNLLVKVGGALVAVGVPGDREVDLARLAAAAAPAGVELVTEADFAGRPDLVRGYLGPQGLPADVPYWADPMVAPGTAWVTGANAPGRHARNVVAGRDFTVARYRSVAAVRAGDPCPRCGAGLALRRGIGVAQVAASGPVPGLDVLGPDGTPVPLAVGSHWLGLSHLVAAVVEQHHDDAGLRWPPGAAPYQVQVLGVGKGEQPAMAAELAERLAAVGYDVLLDDRPGLSAGVRFTDAELLGMPVAVVAGRRAAEGVVELRDRRTGGRDEVPLAAVPDGVAERLGAG